MNLSPEQQELLSAFLDGEVNTAERALAKALLERAEARIYLEQMRALTMRVREHGTARAPADFRQRVLATLEGDFDSISRPTSNQRPAQPMPAVSWRMPLFAAAAAVIVAAGVLFTGVLTHRTTTTPPGGGVAVERSIEDADKQGTKTQPPASRPAETGGGAGSGHEVHEEEKKGRENGKPEPRPPAEPAKNGGAPGDDGRDPEDHRRDLKRDTAAFRETISFDDEATEISVWYNRQTSVTQLYTEILSVSALYGNAQLRSSRRTYGVASVGTDFTDYQGVEIELPESEVPALLAALDRHSTSQGLGRVVVPGYLRRSVTSSLREVDVLQNIAGALARGETPDTESMNRRPTPRNANEAAQMDKAERKRRANDPNTRNADGILPPKVQREMVQRQEEEVLGARKPAEGTAEEEPPQADASQSPARTVRLMIRVQ